MEAKDQAAQILKNPTGYGMEFGVYKYPHKVKHMMWRAAHNAIPSLYNLWHCNVVTIALCPRCKSRTEDTIHALWTCPFLLVVWSNDEMLSKLLRYKYNDFSDLLGMVFLMKERINPNLLATCFWLVWSK